MCSSLGGAHCSNEAHQYATWQKHDYGVAAACHACKKPREEAPASSNKAMAAVSAEKAPDVLREQTPTFMAAMREQLQGTDRVPVREAAFAGMREMEGHGFELGMGMATICVETNDDAILP